MGAFYPERKRLRTLLQQFLQTAPSLGERGAFWASLESMLEEGLDSSGAYPIVLSDKTMELLLEGDTPTPFDHDCSLLEHVRGHEYPVMVDELVASGVVSLSPGEMDWLRLRDVAVILPLPYGEKLFGFICIGRKSGGEDYEPEELRILSSLAPQIALSGENLELIEDQLNRRRMEEQLAFARHIQESLLPGELPSSDKLELAASSRSCLEVAGDYYDVFPLPDGRTVTAIGDVAGKGAGAALLMANLQASLRTAISVGGELVEALSTMNRQLYDSTPSDMFASLFVGLLDPDSCELEYVNAGHNPPLLFTPGGECRSLETGGLILGVTRNAIYRSGSEHVSEGDLLLMFTDGITEAMDEAGAEFGLDRLQWLVRSNPGLPADDLIRAIEQEVDSFRSGAPVRDDQTLVVARANGFRPVAGRPDAQRAGPEREG